MHLDLSKAQSKDVAEKRRKHPRVTRVGGHIIVYARFGTPVKSTAVLSALYAATVSVGAFFSFCPRL